METIDKIANVIAADNAHSNPPEALLLGQLLAAKFARLQRPHIHAWGIDSLGYADRFFEERVEDLGRDKDGTVKYRHILREGCRVTKIASRESGEFVNGTEVIYLLSDGGEQDFILLRHWDSVSTDVEDLEEDEVPAWAWIQFNERIQK